MLHLRLIVPGHLTDEIVDELTATQGVVHVVRVAAVCSQPAGDVVLCDVVREAADSVVERLQDLDVHRHGAISIESIEVVISDAAAMAEAAAPGAAGDALVWEELETRARDESTLTVSFLVFMAIAATIAAAGILLDSSILVIGAMVVGPDYGPLAAICVAVVRGRSADAGRAARTVALGLAAAALAALVGTLLFRLTTVGPDSYAISERELTSFISRPDGMAAAVAILAGVVGMLSLTEDRSGALIGVLVSVTTIPALGNIGAALAYGAWSEVWGAALQLVINIAGLLLAGIVTLFVQSRWTTGRPPHPRP